MIEPEGVLPVNILLLPYTHLQFLSTAILELTNEIKKHIL
jgi:hypothetical protein